MADAGAAVMCRTETELRNRVGELARDPHALEELRRSAAAAAGSRRIPDDLRDLARRRGLTRGGPVPLRAEDGLFLHAQSSSLCQQVGAVLFLEPSPIDGPRFWAAIRQRIRDVPALRQTLERPRSRWRRPHWITGCDVDLEDRIRLVTLGQLGTPGTLAQVVDGFFSAPCDPGRNPWEMLLVRGAPGGRTAVVVKVHHTIGDSHTIIATLSRLFDSATDSVPRSPAREGGRPRRPGWPARSRAAIRTLRGLGHLAAAGPAPAISVCGPFTSGRRRYVPIALPARQVAITARTLKTGIADLLLAVTAEALGGLLQARGEETSGRTVRIAVPRARPGAAPPHLHSPGNRSTAISPELPIGPLAAAERVAAVRAQMRSRQRRGEPDGAALVLRAMNLLPQPLQRHVAAHLYQRRWFNMIVSVFPGVRRSHRLLGARVEQVYPVLALADGTGLAIGAMTWEHSLSVGILADAALVPDVDRFAAEFTRAFRRFETATTAGDGGAH
jgi:WS/DGAT/MGAT family acyltransferase